MTPRRKGARTKRWEAMSSRLNWKGRWRLLCWMFTPVCFVQRTRRDRRGIRNAILIGTVAADRDLAFQVCDALNVPLPGGRSAGRKGK